MKNLRLTVLAALLAVSASQVAFAQAPGMPGGMPPGAMGQPGMAGAPGAPGAAANVPAADSGDVTNAGTSVTSFTTTTSTSGISPDAAIGTDAGIDEATAAGEAENLTNTGGEPVMMAMIGLAIAASAFAFRRKVSA